MSARTWLAWIAAGLFGLATIGFLVAFFVFGFTAALRPGGPDPETDAAGIALIGVAIGALLTALAGAAAVVLEDES